jgi:hypothetical protein
MGRLCENIPSSYHGKEKVEKKYGVCVYQITNLYELDHLTQLCDEKVYLSQGLCDRCNLQPPIGEITTVRVSLGG